MTKSIFSITLSLSVNWQCFPYGKSEGKIYWEIYYWMSFVVNFILPFIILLGMNSIIIHGIPQSAKLKRMKVVGVGIEDLKGQGQKSNNSEGQIFTILLLVSFGFLF